MKFWIAADKDGKVFLYDKRPLKREDFGIFIARPNSGIVELTEEFSIKGITFDNSPKQLILNV